MATAENLSRLFQSPQLLVAAILIPLTPKNESNLPTADAIEIALQLELLACRLDADDGAELASIDRTPLAAITPFLAFTSKRMSAVRHVL